MEPAAPRVVAGYTIGPMIGIGTFGEVRMASDDRGNQYAVKIVDLSRYERDTHAIMDKEIQILRAIEHKHCITIKDVKESVEFEGIWCPECACSEHKPQIDHRCVNCMHDCPDMKPQSQKRPVMMVVQDLAVGGELFALIHQSGPFSEDLARYYFKQLIAGVEYCHSIGVVHRDLKPENLVLDGNFHLKIVDFGMATMIHEQQGAVLHTGVGSLPYSAPEAYYSKELFGMRGYSGEAADLWSCAVILFVMLRGIPPFVRPLDRSYATAAKDRYFIALQRGQGYGNMSTHAKDMLSKMFVLDPQARLSLEQLKHEPWMLGPTPSYPEVCREMHDKATTSLMGPGRKELVTELLKRYQNQSPFASADMETSMLSLHGYSEVVYRGLSDSFYPNGANRNTSTSDYANNGFQISPIQLEDSPHEHDDDDNDNSDLPPLALQRYSVTTANANAAADSKLNEHKASSLSSSSSSSSPSTTVKKQLPRSFASSDATAPRAHLAAVRLAALPPSKLAPGLPAHDRFLCVLPLTEMRSRICSQLKQMHLDCVDVPEQSLISLRGRVAGSAVCGTLHFSELPLSSAASSHSHSAWLHNTPSSVSRQGPRDREQLFLLESRKTQGDTVAFRRVFQRLAQVLSQ